MKQNKYDDAIFFEKYSHMARSEKGLEGAGEWHELQKMLPDFKGKTVLDLGCGYGWHCVYAANNGASSVVGIDISQKMIDVAKSKTTVPNVQYFCTAIEDMDFESEHFDVILSSLALHYIKDFDMVCKSVYSLLKAGGSFVFSCEHPIFTAEGKQEWIYNSEGDIAYWPVDNYFFDGERHANFLGEHVVKYHRSLTTYLRTLMKNGFSISDFCEPQPSAEMMNIPGMKDELRRPMMLLISARKQS